jgi:dipeptidyl aminopeptidase/acylaminoacyl peptidase
MVYLERQSVTGSDLWTLTPDGRSSPLVVTPFNESSASVSADGRFVAYVSDESGRNEVYAIPASGKGDRVTISIDGGTGPVWSRDGRELFYRAGDDLMSVQVRTAGALVPGERRRLLDLSGYDSGYFHEFDVSPDGQRFLLIRTEPGARPTRIDVVQNWFPELTRIMGGK